MRQPLKITLLLTWLTFIHCIYTQEVTAQVTPNEQDCLGAIVICQDLYNQPNSFAGEGNIPNEIPNTTCLGSGEENNVWYTFTAQTSGNLCFTISPYNATDDYDWAVFSLEDYGCEDLWDHADEMVVSCNFKADPGPTGANGNPGQQNEPCIPVTMGVTYVLNVSNFSATQFGYVLDFSASSAELFDDIPPRVGALKNPPLQCGDDTIRFITSELVKCRTVEAGDFRLIGAGGPYTVTSVLKPNCGFLEDVETEFGIVVSPPLRANGNYQLLLTSDAGNIEDQCGNLSVPDTLYFSVSPLDLSLGFQRPTCPGYNDGFAWVEVTDNTDGTFTYTWKDNTNTIIETHALKGNRDTIFGLGPGLFTVEVGLCGTGSLFITDPPGMGDNPVIKNDECSSGTGYIDPKIFGGTPPYSYSWSNGETTAAINNLFSGNYTLTVTDSKGCEFIEVYQVFNLFQPTAEAGPNQSICGLSIQLQASPSQGNGVWTDNSNGNVSYQSSNTLPNALVEVAEEDTVIFYWTETDNGCSDTDSVLIIFKEQPNANAGPDKSVCVLNTTFNAIPSVGSGLWTTPNIGVSFADDRAPNSAVSVSNPGTYTFYWRELNKGCTDRDTVVIDFYDYPSPVAPADTNVAGFSVDLTGSIVPPGVNASWSSACSQLSFSSIGDANEIRINSAVEQCCWVYYNFDFNECSNRDSLMVCFIEPPQADAGENDSICGMNYFLNPQPSVGEGAWYSLNSGVVFSPRADTSHPEVEVPSPGVYSFVWTENNQGVSDSDTVVITFFAFPQANAGQDTLVCDSMFVLDGNQLGFDSVLWSGPASVNFSPNQNTPNPTITTTSYGQHIFIYSVFQNGCMSSDTLEITFTEQPVAYAGADDSLCGDSYTLNAQVSVGNGRWLAHPNVLFDDSSAFNAVASLKGNNYGTYILIWEETNGTCLSRDSVSITYYENVSPFLGSDTMVCANSIIVYNLSRGTNPVWSLDSTNLVGIYATDSSLEVELVGINFGTYPVYLTESNEKCEETDTLFITFNQSPSPNAGMNDTLCGDSSLIFGQTPIGNGFWTSNSGTFADPSSDTTVFYPNGPGNHVLVLSSDNNSCIEYDTLSIFFYDPLINEAGEDTLFCSLEGQLNALESNYLGFWASLDKTISFDDSSKYDAQAYAPSYGVYQLVWTSYNDECFLQDTIEVSFQEMPSPNAGLDDSICGLSYNLQAQPSIGVGQWSNSNGWNFSPSADSVNTTVSGDSYGYQFFVWTENNQGCIASDSVQIHFFEQPNTNAGPNDSVCGYTYNLQASPAIGFGTWSAIDSQVVFSDASQANSQVTVDQYGWYSFVFTDTNGICYDSDTVQVLFYPGPQAAFSIASNNISSVNLVVPFSNSSTFGNDYLWEFGDGASSFEFEPTHTYGKLGTFTVILWVTDKWQCMDSASTVIRIENDDRVYVPNAFSPNGDGINEIFVPSLIGLPEDGSYRLTVFDRWGKLVFQTSRKSEAWDGTFPDGKPAPVGTYAYQLEYQIFGGEIKFMQGRISIIR